jgi:hypothetical protein
MPWMPLGWVGASGAVSGGPTFELISTTLVGSAVASVSFTLTSAQQAAYKHLQLRLTGQPVANGATMWVQFNGDNASNYNHHYLYGNGSTVTSGNGATANGVLVGGVSGFGNTIFMDAVMDILDVQSTSKNKTTRCLSGSSTEIDLASGLWRSTAAISSLTVYFTGTNVNTNSRFSLYGVRG